MQKIIHTYWPEQKVTYMNKICALGLQKIVTQKIVGQNPHTMTTANNNNN